MRKGLFFLLLVGAMLLGLQDSAQAWTDLTRISAGGKAKEVQVNREISRLMIVCQDKPIIINTVVMREGGKKTPFTLGKRFTVGEEFVLDLGGRHQVTGFRISDDLKGSYTLRTE